MKFCFVFFATLVALGSYAQKPPIDSSALTHWSFAYNTRLSNNGEYICYTIVNRPEGANTFCVESVNGKWKKQFVRGSAIRFTADSRLGIFKSGDSLNLLSLGSEKTEMISGVADYDLHNQFLLYHLKSNPDRLFLYDCSKKTTASFDFVKQYQFSPDEKKIILEITKDSSSGAVLQWMEPGEGKTKTIWSAISPGEKPMTFTFDSKSEQLAFLVERKTDLKEVSPDFELWYYKTGTEKAQQMISKETATFENQLGVINRGLEFSSDNSHIFFLLQSRKKSEPVPTEKVVDVWSWTDVKLKSAQLSEPKSNPVFEYVADIHDEKIMKLTGENESVSAKAGDWVLVRHQLAGNYLETFWNEAARSSFYLVSVTDGRRRLVREGVLMSQEEPGLSRDGSYVLYYDYKQANFVSYETATGITRNITESAKTVWTDTADDYPVHPTLWVPWLNSWMKNDAAVFIYDNYDIWQVDPSGKNRPVSITNGFGAKNKIRFRFLKATDLNQYLPGEKHEMMLTAESELTKETGFYSVTLGGTKNPEKRSMGPYVYCFWSGQHEYYDEVQKAKDAGVYSVLRMSATQAPNFFTTTDFRRFHEVTSEEPQRKYNWLTSELVNWKSFDGQILDGILYKPENFDSTKKYPVIFNYYEKRSNELNLFIYPAYSWAYINIPWFVSQGYLVFVPDIRYKIGDPGAGAYNSIVSAAEYLATKPWVDAKHMGLQGHSFGGYQTNYIVTHSSLFAAACAASGISDLVSLYGQDAPGIYPMRWSETGQGRMNATLWEHPERYIDNSPIFRADKITTPLLIMNNKEDASVPFANGLELFLALRRLGKPAWLLQYDGAGHSLGNFGPQPKDFNTRMLEFFDHYLKDKPAPQWMSDPNKPAQ